jgi:hypothetical protein
MFSRTTAIRLDVCTSTVYGDICYCSALRFLRAAFAACVTLMDITATRYHIAHTDTGYWICCNGGAQRARMDDIHYYFFAHFLRAAAPRQRHAYIVVRGRRCLLADGCRVRMLRLVRKVV